MAFTSGGPQEGQPLFYLPSAPKLSGPQALRGKTAEDRSLLQLVDPVAEDAGFRVVRLRLTGGERGGRRLQVLAERADGSMSIDDCARLSRALSHLLDDADPIRGEYQLEVSSPGLERPLTRLDDFADWAGYQARIELDRLVEGRKRFKGRLAGVEGEDVAIDLEGESETALLPFGWISEARLVVDEALLRHGAEARAARLSETSDLRGPQET